MLGSPDSALMVLSPGDSLDSAIEQVHQTEADQLSLLVADGNRTLHSINACETLRQAAQAAGKSITIYSSDEKTCDAAQLCKLSVVRIEASIPSPSGGQHAPSSSSRAGAAAGSLFADDASGLGEADDDTFLAALEQVPEAGAPPGAPRGFQELGSREEDIFRDDIDEDWASALDEFSQLSTRGQQTRGQTSEDEWANAFDNLSEAINVDSSAEIADWGQAGAHVRPEDIELPEGGYEQRQRQRQRRTGPLAGLLALLSGLRGGHARAADADFDLEPGDPAGIARPELSEQEQEVRDSERRRLNLIPILTMLGILLIVAAALLLTRESPSFVVNVEPPVSTSTRTLANIPISYEALSASPISGTYEFATSGTVQGETLMPVSQARGSIQLANTLTQQIDLVKGETVVVGTNPQGQQVRYLVDAMVTLPPAQQSFDGYTYGRASAPIVAVSGGPEYNVPAESQLTIEGIGEAVRVRNPQPIAGGESQPIKVVTQADIDRLLGQALPQLANLAQNELQSQAEQRGMAIAGGTYTPTLDVLANNALSYEIITIPPQGERTDSGDFRLVVRGSFTALAVPNDVDVNEAVLAAIDAHLRQTNKEDPDLLDFGQPSVTFDSQRVIAAVDVSPKGGALALSVRDAIARAIARKPQEHARNILDSYIQQGVISSYRIEADVEVLPPPAQILVEEGN